MGVLIRGAAHSSTEVSRGSTPERRQCSINSSAAGQVRVEQCGRSCLDVEKRVAAVADEAAAASTTVAVVGTSQAAAAAAAAPLVLLISAAVPHLDRACLL